MQIPLFQVDAFAERVFSGNPAAVCPLERWLDEEKMQAIAAENNLSETAFLVPQGDHYGLRWFTPSCEVKLCGHATLASGFVVFNFLDPAKQTVRFETRSGLLSVNRDGELLALDFPALVPWPTPNPPAELLRGLQPAPRVVVQIKDNYFAVYDAEEDVRNVKADLAQLGKLHPSGVAVTAPGRDVDFVSRYFAPSYGIPEDPATGSTHCSLTPYWAARLGKTKLRARQVSQRGGELWCELAGERVLIKGKAALYLKGSISV